MKKETEKIEIPLGAKDSELYKFEYTIPDGYEAEIKDGKVIVKKKESEDERIRKGLIRFIMDVSQNAAFLSQYPELEEWIAYLEKKKESQPLMCDGEIEDKKRDIVAAIRKYYPADYAEYLTSFLKGLSPEDNSEDEYGQEMLGIAYKLMYEHIPENLRTQEFWDSLKFMREYTGRVAIIHPYEQQPAKQLGGTFTSYDMAKTFTEGQNYVIAYPEKFGLCKPAEWSEEDENIYNKALDAIYYKDCNEKDDVISALNDLCDLISRKRKVIPPYARWKPSKKKIDALNSIILNGSFTYVGQTQDLISLKDDLIKL